METGIGNILAVHLLQHEDFPLFLIFQNQSPLLVVAVLHQDQKKNNEIENREKNLLVGLFGKNRTIKKITFKKNNSFSSEIER